MGKKWDKKRSKPIKIPSDPECKIHREQHILPTITNLQSSDQETKSTAVTSILKLILDTKSRKLLLREKLVTLICEKFLTDSNLNNKADGWGILKSLAQEDDAGFCVHLFRQGMLSAIETEINSLSQTNENPDPAAAPQKEICWSIILSITGILALLSNSRREIAEAIAQHSIFTQFLFTNICSQTPDESHEEVKYHALTCLMYLTKDNSALSQKIFEKDAWFQALTALKDSDKPLALLASGILHNIFTSFDLSRSLMLPEGANDASLIPVLVRFMEQSTNVPTIRCQFSNPDKVSQLALQITGSIASRVQQTTDRELKPSKKRPCPIDEDVELEGTDLSEESDIDEIHADMKMIIEDTSSTDHKSTSTPERILESLARVAVPKVLQVILSAGRDVTPTTKYALSTLNQIALAISTTDIFSNNVMELQKSWDVTAQNIWTDLISPALQSDTTDVVYASKVVDLALSLLHSARKPIQIKNGDEQKFIKLCEASSDRMLSHITKGHNSEKEDDELLDLGVKCIGVLGSLASKPASIELNSEVVSYLIKHLNLPRPELRAETVETLHQIFEIYADNTYCDDGASFWSAGVFDALDKMQGEFKHITKAINPRKFPTLRQRARQAQLKLSPFLKAKLKGRASKPNVQS
ncbi:unnamed protein product [Blumeria hordei]|uniref:SYO1-like TPR repeats domain-containing protein n=1 Tax=Blumeria hordei TaxID=2867405 RepID=A0A383UGQ4_BLUHO|nr:unnamed protein product [Blumeria hordei]